VAAGVGRLICTLAAALALSATTQAAAALVGPLGHSGRWITDADGRVVILHGVNMVYKRPPYYPSAAGFGSDDAAFLQDNGFDTVRLGLIYKGVEPQPGNGTLPGGPDATHRQAEATREIKVALILSPQQLDEHRPLSPRQGHNGQVEAVALVTECGLGAGITFLAAVIDQPRHIRRVHRHLPPHLGGQPDALAPANGDQPAVQLARIGELVDVFQAAHPGELEGVARVFGRQPAPASEPPQQRFVLLDHRAPR